MSPMVVFTVTLAGFRLLGAPPVCVPEPVHQEGGSSLNVGSTKGKKETLSILPSSLPPLTPPLPSS